MQSVKSWEVLSVQSFVYSLEYTVLSVQSWVFSVKCTLGCVENGNQRVFKNLLAFFAAIWYID